MKQLAKRVRVQKQKAYHYKGHPIFKFRLNIPSQIIRELGWTEDNFEVLVSMMEGRIIVSKPANTLERI